MSNNIATHRCTRCVFAMIFGDKIACLRDVTLSGFLEDSIDDFETPEDVLCDTFVHRQDIYADDVIFLNNVVVAAYEYFGGS